jgi:NAD(P)-dependent dehydrogenase (short-subunit alcohol dehydrogenase family)
MKNQNKTLVRIIVITISIITNFLSSELEAFDNNQPTLLITGSNRNIGLEFVKQYSGKKWNVIATTRRPESSIELNEFAKKNPNVVVEKLDVTNNKDINALAEKYSDQVIDLLLSNAALTPRYKSGFKKISGVEEDITRQSFEINALGPLKIIQAFMPNVEKSKNGKIIAMSSKASSFGERLKIPIMYSYAMSKSALNSMIYTLSFETKRKNIMSVIISPGMVNTTPGMKIPGAIETEESVTKMVALIDRLTMDDNGKFIDYEDGRVIPW